MLTFIYTGQYINSGLSEIGLQQAEAVGRYLKDVFFTNVFVSDMLRAQQVTVCSFLVLTRCPDVFTFT